MKLIAHRGGTEKYPELTIDGAKHSLENGADFVEMDIRFTKDNVPVICHDETAKRLYGTDEKISDLSCEKFLKLKYVSGQNYSGITFELLLENNISPLLLHIKNGGARLMIILNLLKKYKVHEKTVIGVSSIEDAQTIKKFSSKISVLAFIPSREMTTDFINSDADIIRLWEEWVNEKDVEKIKSAGKKVWVMARRKSDGEVGYTDDENLLKWNAMGIDGVLINEIQKTKAVLKYI